MSYFNCGATVNGQRVRTKKALREALAADPSSVYFDGTSMFSTVDGYAGTEVPASTTLTVVGPDPYTHRQWYASVSVKPDGTLKVA